MRSDSKEQKIAIIGAGMAGITCADMLRQWGYRPVVFDKSRGVGGRLATRRGDEGAAFDHGAQYMTTRSPAFETLLKQAIERDTADVWTPRMLPAGNSPDTQWFVGTATMNALVKPAAEALDICLNSEVKAIERVDAGWRLRTDGDENEHIFDCVVCTVPAPQAGTILVNEQSIVDQLSSVSMAPCWALMVAFSSNVDPGFDVWRDSSEEISWIARNSSKPRRESTPDCWVIHASPEWSRAHLELDREQIAALMLDMSLPIIGGEVSRIIYSAAHRWRYAMTETALAHPYIASDDRTLFLGGDWCLGARVECAYESGRQIAKAIAEGPLR